LIPNWAKHEKIAYKTINAQVETVQYRAIIPPGIHETPVPDSGGRILRMAQVLGGKIPYNIQMKDGRSFAFAELWEGWKPSEAEDWIRT
jgi:putative SOS response-associated peptidase YedK